MVSEIAEDKQEPIRTVVPLVQWSINLNQHEKRTLDEQFDMVPCIQIECHIVSPPVSSYMIQELKRRADSQVCSRCASRTKRSG